MLAKRIGWTMWAMAPVVLLWFHFGAGQRLAAEQDAQRLLREAERLTAVAEEAQGAAYRAQLASIEARRALRSGQPAGHAERARRTSEEEDRAYTEAAAAWQAVADTLGRAHDMLMACGSDRVAEVRLVRGRATIRAGRIAEGVADLESMLASLDDRHDDDASLARRLREEIATGYYYGARLMRAAGSPDAEWRAVSGVARQNFRYLAERARASGSPDAPDLQKNLELVLDLEQTPAEDLMARPLPRNSPGGACDASGLAPKPCQGKGRRPGQEKNDARGAGGVGAIPGGW